MALVTGHSKFFFRNHFDHALLTSIPAPLSAAPLTEMQHPVASRRTVWAGTSVQLDIELTPETPRNIQCCLIGGHNLTPALTVTISSATSAAGPYTNRATIQPFTQSGSGAE